MQPLLLGVGEGEGEEDCDTVPDLLGVGERLEPGDAVGVAEGVGDSEGHVSSRTVCPD